MSDNQDPKKKSFYAETMTKVNEAIQFLERVIEMKANDPEVKVMESEGRTFIFIVVRPNPQEQEAGQVGPYWATVAVIPDPEVKGKRLMVFTYTPKVDGDNPPIPAVGSLGEVKRVAQKIIRKSKKILGLLDESGMVEAAQQPATLSPVEEAQALFDQIENLVQQDAPAAQSGHVSTINDQYGTDAVIMLLATESEQAQHQQDWMYAIFHVEDGNIYANTAPWGSSELPLASLIQGEDAKQFVDRVCYQLNQLVPKK